MHGAFAASCTSVKVSGVAKLDGTYEEGPTTGDPFYRAAGTTFYEMYQFIGTYASGWFIENENNVVYRVREL